MKVSIAITPILFHAASVAAINWDILSHPKVKDFKWARPFPDANTAPGGFEVPCQAEGTFLAHQHKLSDLKRTGSPWARVVESMINGHAYAGSWDGVDHKSDKREVLMMEYRDVPTPVRDWLDEQQQQEERDPEKKIGKSWLFSVYERPRKDEEGGIVPPRWMPAKGGDVPEEDKVLVFPAGAIYEILPLWVAKGSECEDKLLDLSRYGPKAKDDGVIAWPVEHKWPDLKHGRADIIFKIKAYYVKETEDGKAHRLFWEKAHRSLRRHERKQKKKERQEAGKQWQMEKDEL